MRTSYLTCLAIVAASLTVASTSAVPARATVNDTLRPVVDEAMESISVMKFGSVIVVGESVKPDAAEFTRMAGSHIKLRANRGKGPAASVTPPAGQTLQFSDAIRGGTEDPSAATSSDIDKFLLGLTDQAAKGN